MQFWLVLFVLSKLISRLHSFGKSCYQVAQTDLNWLTAAIDKVDAGSARKVLVVKTGKQLGSHRTTKAPPAIPHGP